MVSKITATVNQRDCENRCLNNKPVLFGVILCVIPPSNRVAYCAGGKYCLGVTSLRVTEHVDGNNNDDIADDGNDEGNDDDDVDMGGFIVRHLARGPLLWHVLQNATSLLRDRL